MLQKCPYIQLAPSLSLSLSLFNSCFVAFIFQPTIARLSTLKVTVSHTYLYKKLDEFGKDHTNLINKAVTRHGQCRAQGGQLSLNTIQARASSEPQPIQHVTTSRHFKCVPQILGSLSIHIFMHLFLHLLITMFCQQHGMFPKSASSLMLVRYFSFVNREETQGLR